MVKRTLLMLVLVSVAGVPSALADPSREQVLAAMKKATAFMADRVALRGGYVWAVSEDFATRWGEIPARPTQIWVQAATPLMATTLLDAYDATGDPFYREAARKAIDALIAGQLPPGGWHYFIDFDPAGTRAWYETAASRFTFGYEEYRHFYGNATFDDRVTPDAAAALLRFYLTTREAAYRAPLLKALNFVLEAQFPNGAWPQRYPLRDEYRREGFPDYTSYHTLNDGAMTGNVELLLKAHEAFGDARYLEATRRAADFLIAAQGPEGQAAWAEQFGRDLKPIKARSHEPAGFVIRESQDAIYLLELAYLVTGESRYLAPVPGCLAWFDRVNREAIELKRPPARYWEPGTNLPVYVLRTNRRWPDGYGLVQWTTSTPPPGAMCWSGPCETAIRPLVDVAPIRAEYEEVRALTSAEARRTYAARFSRQAPRRPATIAEVDGAIASMDARGAWVTDNIMVLPIVEGMNPGDRVAIRGIATATFVRNLGALTEYVRARAR
jgi:hypothetical protein